MKRLAILLIAATMISASPTPLWTGTIEARAASQDYCHNYLVRGKKASAVKKSKAKKKARKKWSKKAVSVMGPRSGNWDIATHKDYQCVRAGIWYCKAIAVPCMYRKS